MMVGDLQPVTLDQRGLFAAALAVNKRWSCECNFANVFMWSGVYDTAHTEISGRRVVCNRRVRTVLFPFGDWFAPAELEAVRTALAARTALELVWGDVPQEYIVHHATALQALYTVSTTADEDDYLLRVADTAALAGRSHQNTRRLIRQFGEKAPGWRCGPVTPENREAVLALCLRLHKANGADKEPGEADALHRAFAHFDALGLEGLTLTAADGTPLACSIFSFTTPDVGNVHFEKADRCAPGSAQAMRVSVARHLTGRCAWLNIEQDMGLPGLRRSKRSYLPEMLLPRYRLEPRVEATA